MVGGQADGSPSNRTSMTALVLAGGRVPRRSLTARETIYSGLNTMLAFPSLSVPSETDTNSRSIDSRQMQRWL